MSKILKDPSTKNKQFTIRITIALLLYSVLFFSCTDKTEKTKPVTENITESVYASAIIKTKNQYQAFATVNGIIKPLTSKFNQTLLVDTHDNSFAEKTDRIIEMEDGNIIRQ